MVDLFTKNLMAMAASGQSYNVWAIEVAGKMPLIVETAKNGSVTAKVTARIEEDTPIFTYLHSAYNPEREAEAFADALRLHSDSIVVLFGIGFGYHVEALLRKMGDENKLILVEPDFSILGTALMQRDLTGIWEDNRVFLIANCTEREVRGMLRGYFDMMNLDKAIMKVFQPYTHVFKKSYREYMDIMDSLYHDVGIQINSLRKDGPAWQYNIIRNMSVLPDSLGVGSFKAQFCGVPAVIVSAGPSLDKNIEGLRRFKDKGLIIAAYTALMTLLSHYIVPDIVAAVDGVQLIHESVEEQKKPLSIPLLYMPATDHRLIAKHEGLKIVGLSEQDGFSGFVMSRFHLENNSLRLGGSVACTILDFAVLAGCDPVIFVGQDLSYPPGGKTHAAATHQARKGIAPKRSLIEVEDVFGRTVFTDDMMLTYAKWIQKYVAFDGGNRLYIDATEGGIRIEGTELMTLEEAGRFAVGDAADRLRRLFQSELVFGDDSSLYQAYQEDCRQALVVMREKTIEALALSEELTCGCENPIEEDLWMRRYQELLSLEKQINRINQETGLYDLTFKLAHFTFIRSGEKTVCEHLLQQVGEKKRYFKILDEMITRIAGLI